eukprot:COSAG01_NODE_15678_length_1310_cov_1.984323_1_plen_55_part_10
MSQTKFDVISCSVKDSHKLTTMNPNQDETDRDGMLFEIEIILTLENWNKSKEVDD